jgi:hypothetical protein
MPVFDDIRASVFDNRSQFFEDLTMLSAMLVNNSTLKIHPGAQHGMCRTHADQVNADLLAICRSWTQAAKNKVPAGA